MAHVMDGTASDGYRRRSGRCPCVASSGVTVPEPSPPFVCRVDVDEAVGPAACPALTAKIHSDANDVPTLAHCLFLQSALWTGSCSLRLYPPLAKILFVISSISSLYYLQVGEA